MLILKSAVDGRVFVFLKNPKCASSTLGLYLTQLRRRHVTLWASRPGHSIVHAQHNYASPLYNHCNMTGAVAKLHQLGLNPDDAVFVTTVRKPLSKLVSMYWHELAKSGRPNNMGHRRRRPDFEAYVRHNKHVAALRPAAFRFCMGKGVTHVIRTEAFQDDLRALNTKYGWGLRLKGPVARRNVGKTKGAKAQLPVSPALKAWIDKTYALDGDVYSRF